MVFQKGNKSKSGDAIEQAKCTTPKQLYLKFLQACFKAYTETQTSDPTVFFPYVNLFPEEPFESAWSWMELMFSSADMSHLEGVDFDEQIQNIEQHQAIILKPWDGEKKIVIGCGHKFGNCYADDPWHKGCYTIDIDPEMGPDCIIEISSFSLSRIIPKARGKIEKIVLEGLLVSETPVFHRDILELLAEGGIFYTHSGTDVPTLQKIDGQLYVLNAAGSPSPYKPWELSFISDGPVLLSMGSDALDWESQIAKVLRENQSGIWNHLHEHNRTPFDPDFGSGSD